MRTYQPLTTFQSDESTGILIIGADQAAELQPRLSLRREGEYVAISASYGPIEIAFRPRTQELVRTLQALKPLDGLHASRQVGSGQIYIGLGLHSDGALLLRPTLMGDSHGYIAFNLSLSSDVRQRLYSWLGA